jgi:DNA-directed RNA polymerase specialized sigma24 family protein
MQRLMPPLLSDDQLDIFKYLTSGDRKREDAALEALYKNEELQKKVLNYARWRLHSESDAESFYQEAVLDFWESIQNDRYDPAKGDIYGYIFGIIKKRIATENRNFFKRIAQLIRWQKRYDEQTKAEIERQRVEYLYHYVSQYLEEPCKKFLQEDYANRSTEELQKIMDYTDRQVVFNTRSRCRRRIRELIKQDPKLLDEANKAFYEQHNTQYDSSL